MLFSSFAGLRRHSCGDAGCFGRSIVRLNIGPFRAIPKQQNMRPATAFAMPAAVEASAAPRWRRRHEFT
jgi:hypothetical protein